jgi:hypothetical protein
METWIFSLILSHPADLHGADLEPPKRIHIIGAMNTWVCANEGPIPRPGAQYTQGIRLNWPSNVGSSPCSWHRPACEPRNFQNYLVKLLISGRKLSVRNQARIVCMLSCTASPEWSAKSVDVRFPWEIRLGMSVCYYLLQAQLLMPLALPQAQEPVMQLILGSKAEQNTPAACRQMTVRLYILYCC